MQGRTLLKWGRSPFGDLFVCAKHLFIAAIGHYKLVRPGFKSGQQHIFGEVAFTEGHEQVPQAMIGRQLTQGEAKRLLANSVDSRDYCPGPQDCLQTSCWLVQARLQEPVTPAGAVRLAATEAVPGTHGLSIAIHLASCECRA
jgi:hypothetical protein